MRKHQSPSFSLCPLLHWGSQWYLLVKCVKWRRNMWRCQCDSDWNADCGNIGLFGGKDRGFVGSLPWKRRVIEPVFAGKVRRKVSKRGGDAPKFAKKMPPFFGQLTLILVITLSARIALKWETMSTLAVHCFCIVKTLPGGLLKSSKCKSNAWRQ